jgi:hypothetical protein
MEIERSCSPAASPRFRGFRQELRRTFSGTDPSFLHFRGNRLSHIIAVFSADEQLCSAVAWILHLIGCSQVIQNRDVAEPSITSISADHVDLVLCDMELSETLLNLLYREKSPKSPALQVPPVVLTVLSGLTVRSYHRGLTKAPAATSLSRCGSKTFVVWR